MAAPPWQYRRIMAEVPELKIKYTDPSRGILHWQVVKYGDLTKDVRDRIEAVDLTVHELQWLKIDTLKKINACLAELSNLDIDEDDIWPMT